MDFPFDNPIDFNELKSKNAKEFVSRLYLYRMAIERYYILNDIIYKNNSYKHTFFFKFFIIYI